MGDKPPSFKTAPKIISNKFRVIEVEGLKILGDIFRRCYLRIFLGLGSQGFLWSVRNLLEILGLGLNSENFGIGIEFEKFWDWELFFF